MSLFDKAFIEQVAEAVAERLMAQLGTPQNVPQRLVTVHEAARILGRSPHSVRHLIRSGKLRVVRLDDRVFLDVKDLHRTIEDAKQVAL